MRRAARHFRRSMAALALSVHLVGCYSWKAAPVGPVLQAQQPDLIRVTTVDGQRIELVQWTVRGDSLVGTHPRRNTSAALALADVQDIKVRRLSGVKTGLAVGIPLVIIGGFVTVIAIGANIQ